MNHTTIHLTRTARCAVLVLAALLPFCAGAQLAQTNCGGIGINVTGIYRFGDTRMPNCNLNLQFSGEPLSNVFRISPVRVLQAVDDTGADLAPADKRSRFLTSSSAMTLGAECFQTVNVQAPGPKATVIQEFDAEADLFSATEAPPVFTNFLTHPGQALKCSALDRYQVKLTFLGAKPRTPAWSAETELDIQVEDPRNNLLSLTFEKPDGSILRPAATSSIQLDPRFATLGFRFGGKLPDNLRLIARLAVPETSRTLRFKLENIHLPWADWPGLHVTATDVSREKTPGTNTYAYRMLLTFMGGPIAHAAGIRKLFVTRAEGESGQAFNLNERTFWFTVHPTLIGENVGLGRSVQNWLWLETPSPQVESLRVLDGEVELYNPSTENGGIVEFDHYLAAPGKPLLNDALSHNGVNLGFLGMANFGSKRNEWTSNRVVFVQSGLSRKAAGTGNDSLLFSVEDPENRIVEMDFLDQKGNWLAANRRVASDSLAHSGTNFWVYAFDKLPPTNSTLKILLVTPESLERVPFKLESIPLP